MPEEIILDARELEAPQPFEQATEILRSLKPGEYLKMLHRKVPYPLFDFCNTLSLSYQLSSDSSGDHEIIIYHQEDAHILQEAGVL
ncbi:MAG: DUF2249 domain-containing protein [Spirochaetota bacterium]|nr:DUF2249 domain-containing protein [Spirochaetota bacterium]